MNTINKIFIIKFGNTIEEFKRYSKKSKNEKNVYAPILDYIPQFYNEFGSILKNCFVYWIGIGGTHNKIFRYKNSCFITLKKKISNIYLIYWLLKVNPNLIINISSQNPIIPLYIFILLKNKTKLLQFLAGEYYKNPLNMIFNSLLRKSDGIYVTNNDTRRTIEQITKKKINLFLPLYTNDFIKINNKTQSIREEDKLNVIYCGRFSDIKGIWDLYEIINKLKEKNIIFHLIGGGKEFSKFKSKIEKNKLNHMVLYHGFIPHDNVYNYLTQADIGIIPSKSEGYCSVAHEFMISKVPTLATKVGGLKDIIRDGDNGYLIDDFDKINNFINKIEFLNKNREIINKIKDNILTDKYLNRNNVFGKIVKNYYLNNVKK